MLINSIEYQALKKRIASYLNIDSKMISIKSPIQSQPKIWLVSNDYTKGTLLEETSNSFKRLIN